jgi:hypothetical protein
VDERDFFFLQLFMAGFLQSIAVESKDALD